MLTFQKLFNTRYFEATFWLQRMAMKDGYKDDRTKLLCQNEQEEMTTECHLRGLTVAVPFKLMAQEVWLSQPLFKGVDYDLHIEKYGLIPSECTKFVLNWKGIWVMMF